MSALTRLTIELREKGWRHVLQLSVAHVNQLLGMDEVHMWYERVVNAVSASPASGNQLLIEGTSDDFRFLAELPTIDAFQAQRRLDDGARWWVLLDGERPVFSAWTFVGRMPMVGAPKGILLLPPGVLFLEDSVTAPAARGSGIAVAGLDSIMHQLQLEEVDTVITKVKLGNRPAERLVAKAHFTSFATVRIARRGLSMRTSVAFTDHASNRWVSAVLEAR